MRALKSGRMRATSLAFARRLGAGQAAHGLDELVGIERHFP